VASGEQTKWRERLVLRLFPYSHRERGSLFSSLLTPARTSPCELSIYLAARPSDIIHLVVVVDSTHSTTGSSSSHQVDHSTVSPPVPAPSRPAVSRPTIAQPRMADPSADGAVRICDGNKGENLELCEDYLLARRTASFYHSSCYLANPLRETMMRIGEQTHIGYSIALEIVEVEDWAGGLKLGFTVTNPSDIQFASIHITEVPYMCGFDFDGAMVTSNVVDAVGVQTNGPSQTLPHRHTKTDKVRAILSLSTKKLLLEFNETIVPMDFPVPESIKWAGLTSGTPVWGLIEPYGASALSLIRGVSSLTIECHQVKPRQCASIHT